MNQIDYAYGVAYIRSIENRLLTKADIENLIMSKTDGEAMQVLFDKGYGTEIGKRDSLETILEKSMQDAWNIVSDVSPKGNPLEVLIYRNDFANLKVILKGILSGRADYATLYRRPSVYDPNALNTILIEQRFDDLPEMLKSTAKEAFSLLSRTMDAQAADILIDKAEMDFTLLSAEKSGNSFIAKLVKLMNTMTDLKTAYRCALSGKNSDFMSNALSDKPDINRAMLIHSALSGGDSLLEFISKSGYDDEAKNLSESFSEYEKYVDNKLLKYMDNSKYTAFGIEPLISYIFTKQAEITNIRIILTAKFNNIGEDVIRKNLRSFA